MSVLRPSFAAGLAALDAVQTRARLAAVKIEIAEHLRWATGSAAEGLQTALATVDGELLAAAGWAVEMLDAALAASLPPREEYPMQSQVHRVLYPNQALPPADELAAVTETLSVLHAREADLQAHLVSHRVGRVGRTHFATVTRFGDHDEVEVEPLPSLQAGYDMLLEGPVLVVYTETRGCCGRARVATSTRRPTGSASTALAGTRGMT